MTPDPPIAPATPDRWVEGQFPLAPLDDYPIHQTLDPVRVAATTDPRFYDRYWYVIHDDVGDLLIATGGSFYPNLDLAEAYAIVNYRGAHRSVRAWRRLGQDRAQMAVGPIAPEIVSGLRAWQLRLLENEWGIAYDLDWVDTKRQMYRVAHGSLTSGRPRGAQRHATAGFEGFGTATGWVEIEGQRLDLGAGSLRGTRDRHWGIGRGVGGPGMSQGRVHAPGWKGGNWIDFGDQAVWGPVVLYAYDDPRPRHGKVADVQRRLRFEPETRIFLEGELDYTFGDGTSRRANLRRLGNQTAYMSCAMYGGTPETGIFQGAYVGEDTTEGDFYDVNDPAVRAHLSGLNEHHCEVTWEGRRTTGILQPVEPDAYEACKRGESGWAFLE